MNVSHLWITDFRNYASAELEPATDGLTVVLGDNGQGKSNLIEALAYLANLESFRGAPREALVRQGAERTVLRAEAAQGERRLLIEADIPVSGRERVLVNRQPLRRVRDLLGVLRTTVFSPDDLELVRGGPSGRRRFLDSTLVGLALRHDALRLELERILRQRAALLRQSGGRATPDIESTLDVWDAKLVATGNEVLEARQVLVSSLGPAVARFYEMLAGQPAPVELSYRRSWDGDLASAVEKARGEDLRRGITTVGPHRDDLDVRLGGMPARTHASQGEQRCLALALRLAEHALVAERAGSPPVLLLDDVFSELDPRRSSCLLDLLPPGQAVLTTAGALPARAEPAKVVAVSAGTLVTR
ncbi:MAG TPA: DNA replication/repair protein RecF [Acidimicrobiales bacterium]|nr:DNA replication/repair protein RecF [Acidimicrobiales bacterium]